MNHLASASSPYLLQHAENPVEWYSWGEAAFVKARCEDKPIFLSIGYSTCHWCHVMAHESFENQEIATILNEHFISIKVDREERPDIDRLYMSYVQALTGSGGWPLSVWLTPELKPFFGGTYFPPQNMHGRVGFPSVLLQLAELWRENRSRLEQEAVRAMKALERLSLKESKNSLEEKTLPLQRAYKEFAASFDEIWGGFGMAPKFPRPSVLFFLLRFGVTDLTAQGKQAQQIALKTLEKMALGGLHDHLGGGFHRYSVDRIWQVPHFEKMLYDQAQLASSYLEAWQITGEEKYADVVHRILNYVQGHMTALEGGFYSAEDADSGDPEKPNQKKEGAFYVWSEEEVKKHLSAEEVAVFTHYYYFTPEGNIPEEYDPHRDLMGKNILMRKEEIVLSEQEKKILLRAEKKLFSVREERPRPHLDDKILTAWNGLMISAFARAGAALGVEKYVKTATTAAAFVRNHLYDRLTGKLRRSWRHGKSMEQGFAEDYAFFIQGLLDLYEATFEVEWLRWAKMLQKKMDQLFWDEQEGGYFGSAADDPYLLMRMKEEYDGAEPSANSIAALNHLRFARMLNESAGKEQANAIFKLSAGTLEGMPSAVPQLLVALWYSLVPLRQLVIAGELEWPSTQNLLSRVRKGFHPDQMIMLAEGTSGEEWLAARNVSGSEMKSKDGKAVLYQCEDFCCKKVEAP